MSESGVEVFGPDDDADVAAEVDGPESQVVPGSPAMRMNLPSDLAGRPDVEGPPPSIHVRAGNVVGPTGEVQRAKPRRAPREPTQEEYDEHMLTHAQYRNWCPYCPAASRPNDPHCQLPPFDRQIPLVVADYCFLRSIIDDTVLPTLVGRLYPARATVAVPCDVKGTDQYAVARLAAFLKDSGMTKIVYMSDQEGAIRSVIEAALTLCQKDGE